MKTILLQRIHKANCLNKKPVWVSPHIIDKPLICLQWGFKGFYKFFSYKAFSWSRTCVYLWFSSVGEKRRWIQNKVVHGTITERKIQDKKVMKTNWSRVTFWFRLYNICWISVYFETDCICMLWYLLHV